MCVTHVGTNLQPFLCLIVDRHTRRETLVVRVFHQTGVIQIGSRSKVGEFVCRTRNSQVVLLTQVVRFEQLVIPIIRHKEVAAIVVTKGSIRVEFAVCTNEVLSLWHRVHLIAQTAVLRVQQVLIGIRCRIGIPLADLAIIHGLPVFFVVHTRVSHHTVGRNSTRVASPLTFHGYLCVLGVTAFCSNQHHSVSTTSTVQRIRSSVFQDGNRGNIVVRQRGNHVVISRNTIHHVQRRVAGIHTTNTTNTNLGNLTGLTIRAQSLHTRYLTGKRIRYVARLTLFNVFTLHHRSGTRERLTSGRTESNHHHIVQLAGLLLQTNHHTVLHGDSLRCHTDKRYSYLTAGGDI